MYAAKKVDKSGTDSKKLLRAYVCVCECLSVCVCVLIVCGSEYVWGGRKDFPGEKRPSHIFNSLFFNSLSSFHTLTPFLFFPFSTSLIHSLSHCPSLSHFFLSFLVSYSYVCLPFSILSLLSFSHSHTNSLSLSFYHSHALVLSHTVCLPHFPLFLSISPFSFHTPFLSRTHFLSFFTQCWVIVGAI